MSNDVDTIAALLTGLDRVKVYFNPTYRYFVIENVSDPKQKGKYYYPFFKLYLSEVTFHVMNKNDKALSSCMWLTGKPILGLPPETPGSKTYRSDGRSLSYKVVGDDFGFQLASTRPTDSFVKGKQVVSSEYVLATTYKSATHGMLPSLTAYGKMELYDNPLSPMS